MFDYWLRASKPLFVSTRTFTYDDLTWLETASGTFGSGQPFQNCTYVYSPIGNIDNKCGVALTYGDAMHPSAVTFNPATGKNDTYAANFKFNQDLSKWTI